MVAYSFVLRWIADAAGIVLGVAVGIELLIWLIAWIDMKRLEATITRAAPIEGIHLHFPLRTYVCSDSMGRAMLRAYLVVLRGNRNNLGENKIGLADFNG